jgi:hypothetical protein
MGSPAVGVPIRSVGTQRQVENLVSRKVLAGEFAEGDTVLVEHTADGYVFTKATSEVVAA